MWRELIWWTKALTRRGRLEREMDKEMRVHVDMETEANVCAGMTPIEARRQAMLAFGGLERMKESTRDERGTRWIESIAGDTRHAIRGFISRPGYTIAVVALLAFGIGANGAIFSVVDHLILNPLPFKDGNRMVKFLRIGGGGSITITPYLGLADEWRQYARAVEEITVVVPKAFTVGRPTAEKPERVSGLAIPSTMFAFVHMQPMLGRGIIPADTMPGAAPVVIASESYWRAHLGADEHVIGTKLVLDGTEHTLVGVAPRKFAVPFSDEADLFTAYQFTSDEARIDAVAKLRIGATVADANREMRAWVTAHGGGNAYAEIPQVRRRIDDISKRLRNVAVVVFGAVALVLFVAAANAASLSVVRAWARQREFAVRTALGAGVKRLVAQALVESVLLALVGGAAGLGVAAATLKLLGFAQPDSLSVLETAVLDVRVVGWCAVLTILSGLLLAIPPARVAIGGSRLLTSGLRSGSGSTASRRFRSGLVVLEIAMSVVLLVGTGLLVRTIGAMRSADIGMDPTGLRGVHVSLGDPGLKDSSVRAAAVANALTALRAMPGVASASMTMSLPPDFAIAMGGLEIEGRVLGPTDSLTTFAMNVFRPEAFAVAGLRMRQGRVFAESPSMTARLDEEIVVGEAFARRFWPNGDAIGARMRRQGRSFGRIVGVVRDIDVPGANRPGKGTQVYFAMPTAPAFGMLLVRTSARESEFAEQSEKAIHDANPLIKIDRFSSAESAVLESRDMQRYILGLLGAFAALAVMLTMSGLYAVISHAVAQRTREIGVRMALGAQRTQVVGDVVRQGMMLAGVGVVVGALGALGAARVLRGLLYGVGSSDPVSMVAAAVLLGGAALVAMVAPARRAARVSPVEALRSE